MLAISPRACVPSRLGALGYPAYFLVILGVWKLLGVVAIAAPGLPRLKEWAYAGFSFDLSGAFVSHLQPHEIAYLGVPAVHIDLMCHADGIETEGVIDGAVVVPIGDLDVPFISLGDLIANKQASGRPQMSPTSRCSEKFVVELDLARGATQCNCSICTKLGAVGAIAKPDDLRVVSGESDLGMYEWGGKTGQRYFCKTCGVYGFSRGYLEQMGGAYVSVNLNALDDLEISKVPLAHWDGRHDNWMAGMKPQPWPIHTEKTASA